MTNCSGSIVIVTTDKIKMFVAILLLVAWKETCKCER